MQVLRNHSALHHQRSLDQAGDAGSRLQVADVGLHGTDQERTAGFASLAVDRGHRFDLDRVAYRGARPVRLQVIDIRSRVTGLRERRFNHLFQRRGVRHGQPDAGPAVIHRRTPDHPPDAVTIRFGLTKPLQDYDTAALAAHIAVRGGIERLALSVRRQHHGIRAELENATVQDGLHTARNGQVRLALLQVRHGVVDRHHGRRAGGVHSLRRPHEAQHERDPSAGTVQVGAAQRVEA